MVSRVKSDGSGMSNDGDVDRSFFLIVENLLELLVSTKILPSDFMDFFSVALRPNVGHDLPIFEVSRSHTTTHHSR
jgi:hypothetical protein